MPDRGWTAPQCRGEALPRPPAPSFTLVAGGTARWAGRVRHRLTPTGRGIPTHRAWSVSNWRRPPLPCTGEALPRPPAPWARQYIVADTSRPTRSADQPSGPLHDRPAVNGRAQSPSRLKPADPNSPCTTPIDPGAWAPHSPLQGACGLSPGLQPRAFAADRPASAGRGTTAPFGVDLPTLTDRRVRQRLTPTGRRRSRDPWRVFAAPPMRRLNPVGARHGLSPPRAGYCPITTAASPGRDGRGNVVPGWDAAHPRLVGGEFRHPGTSGSVRQPACAAGRPFPRARRASARSRAPCCPCRA